MKILETSVSTGGIATNTLYDKFRHMSRGSDTVNSFGGGGDKLKLSADYQSKMTASTVTTKVSHVDVTYNNTTGAITWGGVKLDFKGIGDPRVERNILIQQDGNGPIKVWRGNKNTRYGFLLDPTTGKMVMDANGLPQETSEYRDPDLSALTINNGNVGGISNGTGGPDVIINRQNNVKISSGSGYDKVFNFAKTGVELSGGRSGGLGSLSIYSVGVTNSKFTALGEKDSYLKLLGNTSGTEISMSKGANFIDAAGLTLKDVTITGGGEDDKSSGLIAKSVTGASTIDFAADYAALDLKLFDATNAASKITFGGGVNSAVIDTLKGEGAATSLASTGKADSFQFKTVTNGVIDASGADADSSSAINITGSAKESAFNLGAGVNTLNAAGKTLNSVTIKDKEGAVTSILAGSITGTAGNSTITLAGNAETDDDKTGGIVVKGVISKTDIKTDDKDKGGTVQVTAGSIKDSTLAMGKGKDVVIVNGAIVGSTIDLGAGANSLTAEKNSKAQAITNTTITAGGATAADKTTIKGGAYRAGETAVPNVNNHITLGGGANSVTLSSVATGKGVAGKALIDLSAGGGGETQTLNILGRATNLDYKGSKGVDNVLIEGALQGSNIGFGVGTNTLTVVKNGKGQNITNTAITDQGRLTFSDTTIITGGAFRADSADNVITLKGEGANSVTLDSIATAKGVDWATITLGTSTTTTKQTLKVAGAVSNLAYTAKGATSGSAEVGIGGTLRNSKITLGDGINTLTIGKSANKLTYTGGVRTNSISVSGALSDSSVVFKAGGNALSVGQAISNTSIKAAGGNGALDKVTITAGAYKAGPDHHEIELLKTAADITLGSISGTKTRDAKLTLGGTAATGAQSLNVAGAVTGAEIAGGGAANTVTIGKSATNLTYTGGAGADNVTIGGAVKGATLSMGDGANTAKLGGAAVNLAYTGGAGADNVTIGGKVTNGALDLDVSGAADVLNIAKMDAGGNVVGGYTLDNVNIAAGEGSTLNIGAFKPGSPNNGLTIGDNAINIYA